MRRSATGAPLSRFSRREYGKIVLMRKSESERFWEKVDRSGKCWEWTAYKLNGYGRFGVGGAPKNGGRIVYAHRWAWESVNGPIPNGMTVDHLCRNRGCQNPDHMELVSPAENTRRQPKPTRCPQGHEYSETNPVGRCRDCNRERCIAYARAKGIGPRAPRTHCKHGHEFTPENTYVNPKTGQRFCRTCGRKATRQYLARKRVSI